MRTAIAASFALALPILCAPFARAAGDAKAPAKPAAKAVPALQRLAVVGASMSAGFGLDPEANPLMAQESRIQLVNVVEASLRVPHEPPANGATMLFFTAPEPTAKRSLEEAKKAKASALVALDYLFWMGYGPGSDEKREKRLEAGLKLLEGFDGPILLGDLPDFRGADVDPMMLSRESIPPPETLAKLNRRIEDWASKRSNVVLVPLAEMLRKLLLDEAVEVRGNTFEKGATSRLLQKDHLHLTLEGTCATWVLAVDAWLKKDAALTPEMFELDVAKLAQAVEAAAAAPAEKAGKSGKPKAKKPGEKAGAGS